MWDNDSRDNGRLAVVDRRKRRRLGRSRSAPGDPSIRIEGSLSSLSHIAYRPSPIAFPHLTHAAPIRQLRLIPPDLIRIKTGAGPRYVRRCGMPVGRAFQISEGVGCGEFYGAEGEEVAGDGGGIDPKGGPDHEEVPKSAVATWSPGQTMTATFKLRCAVARKAATPVSIQCQRALFAKDLRSGDLSSWRNGGNPDPVVGVPPRRLGPARGIGPDDRFLPAIRHARSLFALRAKSDDSLSTAVAGRRHFGPPAQPKHGVDHRSSRQRTSVPLSAEQGWRDGRALQPPPRMPRHPGLLRFVTRCGGLLALVCSAVLCHV